MRLLERIATCYGASYGVDVIHDRSYACCNHVAYPKRCKTKACNGNDEANNSKAFVPSSVSKFEVMLVGASAIKYLTYYTQDVDCGDYDRAASSNGEHAVEGVGILE